MTGRPQVCVHELFEAQARRTPGAVALRFEDTSMTYAELDAAAERLADVLADHGVGPEMLVGLACGRSLAMMVALIGILKAGGAYVPIDLESPPRRIAGVLEQCGNPWVVTSGEPGDRLPPAKLIRLDQLPAGPAVVDRTAPGPDNLVYVIFTSGSTGQPKGVMNEHAPVANRLLWMIDQQRLGPGDKVLQKTPLQFDVSVWEMFWPLCVGATLVLARPGGHRDADYLVRTVVEAGITVVHFVPSMLYAFLEHPGVRACTGLTRVYCSGEALTPELQERCYERLPAVELHNLYGPTEAAIEVSHWPCVRGSATVPIGWPIANTRLYVLDEQQQPATTGELYIAGVPVARGYLNRPDLTDAVFRPDPYGEPGDRMYRTGDRVRRREDGAIEYLGRLDTMVKLRGQRIELGEIEACLETHPAVARAVVVVRTRGETDQRLVAYVVLRSGSDRVEGLLRAHLRDRLPGYMVPAAFVYVGQLPLTVTGKVDRAALPDPTTVRPDRQPPREGLETEVARVWAEVLAADRPDRRDSFLGAGGNSLLATVLAARISHAFGTTITVAEVFAAACLADLAATVGSAMSGPEPVLALFPPARSQDELWLERLPSLSDDEVDELLSDVEVW